MKRKIMAVISLLLCFAILCATPAVNTVSAKRETVAQDSDSSEKLELFTDKLVNQLIDMVHRFLMIIRYPWQKKTNNTIDLSKFELVFADEFNGNSLNKKVWNHYRQGERKGGYWDSNQATVYDGNLHIRAEYKADGKYGPGYYCDRIDTRKGYLQKYGYFECRCILPAAQGLWSSFWLSSENIDDFVPGTEGTEIDVFESPLWYRGERGLENNLVTSNLHYGGYELGHRYHNVAITKVNNPYKEYNTYGVEWNENGYIFYINGKETGRSKFGGVSKVPEYMLLSIEIDGAGGHPSHGWSGIITANDPGALPADFVVDYVRAYQYKDSAAQ
ncbi:MAG: glycoside hydrolase family 16 protein [Clostridiales bacterium]|nr:glycoside hydrolase family 16 protein [Clostridiales bacterium]